MNARIPVSVLGATGVVGQRFVRRLARHPWFEVRHLAASGKSAGKRYDEACEWRLGGEPYAGLGAQRIVACDAETALAPVAFSALDTAPALEIEPAFARAGAFVFSNAAAFRMEPDVPLLIPEVNPDHLDLLEAQRAARGWAGAILTNPNCTTTVLVLALAPLHARFGVEKVAMTSMQAVSGAGYPGVASLDALGNVLPYIKNEEQKVEEETCKLLGTLERGRIRPAGVVASAACHRVPVVDGHTEAVSVQLKGAPSPEQVVECLSAWSACPQELGLPTAPPQPIRVRAEVDRPQVRLDVEQDGGMSVHVGRVRRCAVLGVKMTLLGHNAERGAAGGSILNAELAYARGILGAVAQELQ